MKYRHGDLLIVKTESIPDDAKTSEMALANGRYTGHSHMIEGDAKVFESKNTKYILVKTKAKLTHDEHDTIELPKGRYKVIRQVEYTPEGLREVED